MLLLLPSRDKRNLFVGDKKLLSESHRRHFNYALIKLMDDFLFGEPVRVLACKKNSSANFCCKLGVWFLE